MYQELKRRYRYRDRILQYLDLEYEEAFELASIIDEKYHTVIVTNKLQLSIPLKMIEGYGIKPNYKKYYWYIRIKNTILSYLDEVKVSEYEPIDEEEEEGDYLPWD